MSDSGAKPGEIGVVTVERHRAVGPATRSAALLGRSLREDAERAFQWVFIGRIAGSALVPRAVRYVLYRLYGLDIRTPNIMEHCFFTTTVHIGRDTCINEGCYFEGAGPIHIGDRCQIGYFVRIITSHHDITADGMVSRRPYGKAVAVGQDCWIGTGSTLLPGVTVGEGTVIAAGSVVTADCESHSLYGGVPARRIRSLRADEALSPPPGT